MKYAPAQERVEEISKKLNINWQDAHKFASVNNPTNDTIVYNMSNWNGENSMPEEKMYFEFYTNPIATQCVCGYSEFGEGQEPKFTGTYKQCPDIRNITVCPKCGVGRLAVIPRNYIEYYTSGFFASKKTERLTDFEHEIEVAKLRLKKMADIIPIGDIKHVLDIGCAIGAFLNVLDNNGIDAVGIEVCDFEHIYRQSLSEKIYTLEHLEANYSTKYFDVITIFDVLEHIYDIDAFLKRITQFLKPNGHFIIEVPNMGKDKFEITEENKHHVKVVDFEHIWYFTEKGINDLLEKHNFQIKKLEDPVSGKMAIYADISTVEKIARVTPIDGNIDIVIPEVKKKKVVKIKSPSMRRTEIR